MARGSVQPHLWGSQSLLCPGSSIPSLPSEFEGQSDNSRMESEGMSQAFQVLVACMDIMLSLCFLMLFHWVVFINTV